MSKKTKAHLGSNIDIDIATLIDTRLLIQANSGGGKSYVIRKLLEETNGAVQQIIIDIEGDFSSLREKYPYVLAGKGGDIPADPRSAEMLAIKLLELKADCIIDLYELKQHERIRFVKLFLEAMVNAKKDLWHNVLLVLDEAHIFCPEKGSSEASGAVIDICTRGRKRGYCAVLATQRISKLHKDAAAECNNKLIGRTGLDIDMKRAGDELGLDNNKQKTLRTLEPGSFYVFGPAISNEVLVGKVDKAKTTHARAGQRGLGHKPPPSSVVKEKLAKLADLPAQAEEERLDRDSLRAKVRDLERELKKLPQPGMDKAELDKAVEKAKKQYKDYLDKQVSNFKRDLLQEVTSIIKKHSPSNQEVFIPTVFTPYIEKTRASSTYTDNSKTPVTTRTLQDGEPKLGACEKAIVGFLSSYPDRLFSKTQVAAMSGYAKGSGGFNNALSRLNQYGFIQRVSGQLKINPDADVSPYLDGVPHTLQDWVNKLGTCEKKIYELALHSPDENFTKEQVAEATGYAVGSGGFNNALSRLNTLGLIQRDLGKIKLNPDIASL